MTAAVTVVIHYRGDAALQAAVYLLTEVPEQHQEMINEFLEAQWKKFMRRARRSS